MSIGVDAERLDRVDTLARSDVKSGIDRRSGSIWISAVYGLESDTSQA